MAPNAPRRYRAFVSYSRHDAAHAVWVQRALESYRMPPRLIGRQTPYGKAPARLRPIFRDETELAASPNLSRSLADALETSEALIVVCSPAAAASKWVDKEIADFIRFHGRERVLAIICDGAPEDGSCFPPSLLAGSATGDPGGQPIAADLRPGHDGPRLAKLKLVAGTPRPAPGRGRRARGAEASTRPDRDRRCLRRGYGRHERSYRLRLSCPATRRGCSVTRPKG